MNNAFGIAQENGKSLFLYFFTREYFIEIYYTLIVIDILNSSNVDILIHFELGTFGSDRIYF